MRSPLLRALNGIYRSKPSPHQKGWLSAHNWAFHYYREILRHRNQVQYIFRKSARSLAGLAHENCPKEVMWFFVYRVKWEGCSLVDLWDEIRGVAGVNLPKQIASRLFHRVQSFDWGIALQGKSQVERLSLTSALPSFFIARLQMQLGAEMFNKEIAAMKGQPDGLSVGIFFPQGKFEIGDFQGSGHDDSQDPRLAAFFSICQMHGIKPGSMPLVPGLFVIPASIKPLFTGPALSKADIEGEGLLREMSPYFLSEIPSFLTIYAGLTYLAEAVGPTASPAILDMCAAPGNKTRIAFFLFQRLCSKFHGNLRLIAQDLSRARVKLVPSLFGDIAPPPPGLQILLADGLHPAHPQCQKFDLVVLDAPCTGSGTFVDSPELKWRQSSSFLRHHVSLQRDLLRSATSLVRDGGFLLYSTCSMYPEEGELHFVSLPSGFVPCPLPSWFSTDPTLLSSKVTDVSTRSAMARFSPASTHSIGFFCILLQKVC